MNMLGFGEFQKESSPEKQLTRFKEESSVVSRKGILMYFSEYHTVIALFLCILEIHRSTRNHLSCSEKPVDPLFLSVIKQKPAMLFSFSKASAVLYFIS